MNALYIHFTIEIPTYGGKYQEGMVGQPLYVNPLLSSGNPADADLVRLVYAGLLEYDDQGKLTEALAESWQVSEDGLEYTVFLKSGLTWHDGEEITVEDVLFTFEILQNPTYRSPLRQKMPTGLTIERVDDLGVKFILKEPFLRFPDELVVGILPKHIWDQVNADRFARSKFNLEPIGSGPYRYVSSRKDSEGNIISYTLKAFAQYYAGMPYIKEFSVFYYNSEDALLSGYKQKEIRGAREISEGGRVLLGSLQDSIENHEFPLPQYYTVFFNQTKSKPLAYDEVRQALALATDRTVIIEKAMAGKGVAVQAPFLEGEGAYRDDILQKVPNKQEAESILETAGWIKGDDGVRVREDVRLEFTLVTADWEEFIPAAEALKEQWETIGARVNISIVDTYNLSQNYIRPREYDALLYVQAPDAGPNLFSYWHSSQRDGAGLNLSVFSNKTMDEILEKSKTATDQAVLDDLNRQFQDIFFEKNPGVYLFSPIRLYPIDKRVFGVQPRKVIEYSDRLGGVEKWYMSTKREWKE